MADRQTAPTTTAPATPATTRSTACRGPDMARQATGARRQDGRRPAEENG
jgi:hypothetical protein